MDSQEALRQLYHQGIYNAERGIMRLLGVDPSLLDYASKRPTEFGFHEDSTTSYEKNYQDAMRHILLGGELQRTPEPRWASAWWTRVLKWDLTWATTRGGTDGPHEQRSR